MFKTYHDWREAITVRCGLTLDRPYCEKRIAALADPSIPSTRSFLKSYGSAYRDQIVQWFTRAASDA